jgi:hypothetical protein
VTPRCPRCHRAVGFKRRPSGFCRRCSVIDSVESALRGTPRGRPVTATSIIAKLGDPFYTIVSHAGNLRKKSYINISGDVFFVEDIEICEDQPVVLRLKKTSGGDGNFIPVGTCVW